MRHLDEYRDPAHAQKLVQAIHRVARRRWTIMEVCGGQTHGLLRYGIDRQLEQVVELIHGPGCPVCVTPAESIDFVQRLALQPNVIVTSFGDMLRVPGSRESLLETRASGGNLRLVYSPLDAVQIAYDRPDKQVVFFAVGFETTAPASALAVLQAAARRLSNFSLLLAHVRVQPAMEMLLQMPDNRIQGFLAAGHVCTVTGYQCYQSLVDQYRIPVVVSGFEPTDLLEGILACIRQLESGVAHVENCYRRSVRPEGNRYAQALIDQVFEVCDRTWRGWGTVAKGGFRMRSRWQQFDADYRFAMVRGPAGKEHSECRSAEVLAGRLRPSDCPAFGTRCTPDHPLGAPMVSSEGACAAYYRYHGFDYFRRNDSP